MFEKIQLWFSSIFKKAKVVEEPKQEEPKQEEPKQEEPKQEKPKSYITYHAKIRFQERHGIVFTDEQAKGIVEDIISKKAEFIETVSNKAQRWIAEHNGKKYRVVYSPKSKVIITVYSGLKNKRSKPKGRKRIKASGTHRSSWRKRPKPDTYKRNKRVWVRTW